jgi:sulfur relay (sulfurtransferase) DsrF/TusC family protein
LRAWVEYLINKNLSKMEKDLKKLEPKDRLVILERLMQYTIPKQQSISVEAQIQAEYASLEKLLSNADEVIKEITERVIRLNQLNSKENE